MNVGLRGGEKTGYNKYGFNFPPRQRGRVSVLCAHHRHYRVVCILGDVPKLGPQFSLRLEPGVFLTAALHLDGDSTTLLSLP